MLAGPFMAFFANIIDKETSLQVLDRVMLEKSKALEEIIKHVFSGMKEEIMKLKSEKLHPYMVKQLYVDAVREGKFFPLIKTSGK